MLSSPILPIQEMILHYFYRSRLLVSLISRL
uniref:Uncharacterized protein n=1 Tax=Arundo donax TaxID=35708 RepID=A0A0A9BEF8_ARUDO